MTEVVVVGGGPVGLAAAIEARLARARGDRGGAARRSDRQGVRRGAHARCPARCSIDSASIPRGCRCSASPTRRSPPGRPPVPHRTRPRCPPDHPARRTRPPGRRAGRRAGRREGDRGAAGCGRCRSGWGSSRLAARGRRTALDDSPRPRARAQGARTAGSSRLRKRHRVAPWSDLIEVHWSKRGEVYVTPVAPDVGRTRPPRCPAHRLRRDDRRDPRVARTGARHRGAHRPARLGSVPPARVDRAGGPGAAGGGCIGLRRRDHRRGTAAGLRPGTRCGRRDRRGPAAGLPRGVGEGDPGLPGADLGARAGRILTLRGGIVPLANAAPWLYAAAVEQLAR